MTPSGLSANREQDFFRFINPCCEISRSALVGVKLHHQSSVCDSNLFCFGVRLEAQHFVSLRGCHGSAPRTWLGLFAIFSLPMAPAVAAPIEIGFRQNRALRVCGSKLVEQL